MSAVDQFLKAIENAAIDACDVWADDCLVDATVPNWRLRKRGPDAIRGVYGQWFAYPNTLLDVRRWTIPEGEIVEYVHSFTGANGPRQAHHLHVIELQDGLIVRDTMFCGGQWAPAQLAEMAAAQ